MRRLAVLTLIVFSLAGCDQRDGRCAGLNERDRALCTEAVTQEGHR